MKTKKFFAIAIIVLMLAGLFTSCKVDIDTSHLTPKPDVHAALAAYKDYKQKKSVFNAGLKITLFKPDSGNTVIPISIGQLLQVDRILNNDKIYMDATLGAAFVSPGFFSMVDSLTRLAETFDMDVGLDPEVLSYIRGETQFVGKLGYDGVGNYNGKGDYITKGETPDYKDDLGAPYWAAINDSAILNIQKNMKSGTAYTLKDFLMFSTMIDLSVNDGWVIGDAADKYYNNDSQSYLYAFTTSGAKLKALILDMIGDTSEGFDEEQYAEELRLYADIIPTVSNWISTPNSTINVSLDQASKLKTLSSSIRIDINVKVQEMWDIVALLLPEDQQSIITAAKIMLSNFFVAASGEYGTWTIRIDFTTEESFYYDAASISLENVDSDLFIPVSQDVEGRHEIAIMENQAPAK